MHKWILITASALPFSLCAMHGFFDIDAGFDPVNMKSRSHFDIAPQSAVSFKDKAWLVSPRFSVYMDGSFDVAIASGMRHTIEKGYLGHHVFWTVSQTNHGKFHQLGHSLDFLTPAWDFRVNYYHPITKNQMDELYLYSTHIWAESEAVWKGKNFNIGMGPRYNFTTECYGGQLRFVVPFKYFNLGAVLGYDYNSEFSCTISLSFTLYNSRRPSQLYDPISHKSRVRYEKIELPIHNKAKEPKEEQQKKSLENLGLVKDVPDQEIVEDPLPKEEIRPPESNPVAPKLWKDLFFFDR